MNQNNLIFAASYLPTSLPFPSAWIGHIPFAAWLIKETVPKILVELGTHWGHSYFSFCQAVVEANISTKCYAVDTWKGDEHTDHYGEDVFELVVAHNKEHYDRFSRLLRMTFDEARVYFNDGSIDLLHLDGMHSYEAVKHDFETWLPKLAPAAVVVLHDTNVRERGFGVWKFWEELRVCYPLNIEFIHSHGLGVIQLDNGEAEKKLSWLVPGVSEKKMLKNYFSALGARQVERFELRELQKTITDRDNQVTSLIQAVGDRDGQVSELNQAVVERDRQIADLNQAVVERDRQITDLNQAVVERDRQIADLNQAVTERDGQIASLSQEVNDRDRQIVDLNLTLAGRERHIDELLSTSSWRLTAPLRMIKKIWRMLLLLVTREGGVTKSTFKTIDVFKREGWQGIKQRLFIVQVSMNKPDIIVADGQRVDQNDYGEWIRHYDTLTDKTRSEMVERIKEFEQRPLISLVMPTYNSKPDWLTEAIESVRIQIYPNWELCIADDASTSESIRTILESYAKEDSRIKIVFREKNGHISASSNSALELVTGEYIALLDHDDLLAEHALFWVTDAINSNPDAQLIYSDEDKIDQIGRRYDPYFKSDWNPDLFLSHNMISHLGVYRTDLVREIGGFREGYEGSQDYDLALRCIEQIDPHEIVHVPRVLYHWRSHPGSTAQAGSEKNYALQAGERALNDHFKRIGVSAKAELLEFGMYRVHYDLPKPAPLVTLIIPTRNSLNLIMKCINSILSKSTYRDYEILIVDNNSDDVKTLEYLNSIISDKRIRVLRDERPFNFSALNNSAVLHARGEYVGLINNDIEVITPQWLDEMMSLALQPGVGAVGACLWYPNDTLQHGGCITGILGVAGHIHRHLPKGNCGYFGRAQLIQTLSVITAACMVVKKSIYHKVGGLDESNLKVAFNDIDFCLRVRDAGYRNIWTPYAELYHHESASRGFDDTSDKQMRFRDEVCYMQKRWTHTLFSDPAYNPNLSLDREDFSLSWPPRVKHVSI
jgi:glycosyltransferase involved in cell wall biosynthesis